MDQLNNLVSVCYVIQEREGDFAFPNIYLVEPRFNEETQRLHMFYNVFDARKYINDQGGSSFKLEVIKELDEEFPEYIECK